MTVMKSDKKQPSSHSFPLSPVKKVYWMIRTGDSKNTGTIPAPYPGWDLIRGSIQDTIPRDHTGDYQCLLEYHDRFYAGKRGSITRIFMDEGSWTDVQGKKIHLTYPMISQAKGFQQGVTAVINHEHSFVDVIFRVDSGGNLMIMREGLIPWFDEAHEVIHILFDRIISNEMIKLLREGKISIDE